MSSGAPAGNGKYTYFFIRIAFVGRKVGFFGLIIRVVLEGAYQLIFGQNDLLVENIYQLLQTYRVLI